MQLGRAVLAGALVVVGLAVAACRVNGDPHAFRQLDNGLLAGPWGTFEEIDEHDEAGVIPRKSGDSGDADRRDAFTIHFDTAYFRYLPDMLGVNEAVVVFTFTEGPPSKDENTLVKILGPMKQLADGSYANQFSRISYGPKLLEGDSLSIKIQIFEMDTEEANDAGAAIDFIGSAAEAFSLADPVTAGQIKLAKEIGKTLVALNQNDLVFETTFDLLPYDEKVWKATRGRANSDQATASLPLRVGTFGLIKQEQETHVTSFFPLTRKAWSGDWSFLASVFSSPFSLAGDALLLPITATTRTFGDVPDHASMRPISNTKKSGYLNEAGRAIVMHPPTRKLMWGPLVSSIDGQQAALTDTENFEPYQSKTWITFSIEQGRDPALWQVRKLMSESEKKLLDMLQEKSLKDILDSSKVLDAIKDLQKVVEKQEELKAQREFALLKPSKGHVFSGASVDVTIRKNENTTISKIKLVPPSGVNLHNAAAEATPSKLGTIEFGHTFTPGAANTVPAGEYTILVTYKVDEKVETTKIPLVVVTKPTVQKTALSPTVMSNPAARWSNGSTLTIVPNAGDFALARKVTLQYTTASGNKGEATFKRDETGATFEKSKIVLPNPANEDIASVEGLTITLGKKLGGITPQ